MSGASEARTARLCSEQALVSALIRDPASVGPIALASAVAPRDFGNVWFQQMYGALVEDGLWHHPYVKQAATENERVRTLCFMLYQRLQTRMQALADGALAEADAAARHAELAVRRAEFAHRQAEEARADTEWWLENAPDNPMAMDAQAWEAQAWARASISVDDAERAAQARDKSARRAASLGKTVASDQAWARAWDAMWKIASPEHGAAPYYGGHYARQVLEHGIAQRVHQVGEELMAKVHAPGASAAQQIADIRAAMDQLAAEQVRTGSVEPILPTADVADLENPERWEALRTEGQVMISLVAHPEQLAHSDAAGLQPRDMSRPEHAYLLAAVIEQQTLGLEMDPYQLTQRAWAAAQHDGTAVDTGYLFNMTMTARHQELTPHGPSPQQLARIARQQAPSLIALSVQRQAATVIAQMRVHLEQGIAPRDVVSSMRSGLAHVEQQALRHPQALADQDASYQGATR
ncbi:hypothetical protein ACWCQP_48310 [Streptomyces chartreusis]